MDSAAQNLNTLKDIKRIMERSSRFISLSGWSGVTAGLCALIGAIAAWYRIRLYYEYEFTSGTACPSCLKNDLMLIAACVFVAAFATATSFTYVKSKKESVAIWGVAARRLLWNTLLPMIHGAFMLWRMMELKQ